MGYTAFFAIVQDIELLTATQAKRMQTVKHFWLSQDICLIWSF